MVSYDKFDDGSIYCWMAGVEPESRKNGILNKMMKMLFDWAKRNGYDKVKIKTRNNRHEMLSFLVKNGFYFTEVVEYPTIDENRIMLEKHV